MTEIPGACLVHETITDRCRRRETDFELLVRAFAKVARELVILTEGWPVGRGATFHLALTVEKPTEAPLREARW